jgi:carbonic anhydrase
VQFHFHSPSEHRVGGVAYAAEMHLVHKADDGSLAVVGVLIKQGQENPNFSTVWSQLPKAPGPVKPGSGQVDAAQLLPKVHTSFRYGGSLTTPPCSERVNWTLMATPIEMSEGQLKAFTGLYTGNNRPVQPLNGRIVVQDTTP